MGLEKLSIAIVRAGIGGMAICGHFAANRRKSERLRTGAAQFARVGAGIQMMPNSMKVLRRSAWKKSAPHAFQPYSHLNREWDTGKVMRELPMPENLFGAPYLCMHRADLHDALAAVVPPEIIHFEQETGRPGAKSAARYAGFRRWHARASRPVIGADGVHSMVRDIIVGPDAPIHKAASPIARCFHPAAEWHGYRPLAHEVVGYRPAHRHLLHHRQSQRTLFRHQRSRTRRMDDARILVRQGRCERIAPGLSRVFTPTCAPCSKPAPTATNGRSSSANLCRAGATGAWCCSAMPATP